MSMLLGLFTELNAPGGIQRAGRHIAAVLKAYAEQNTLPWCFLSLNDSEGFHTIQINHVKIVFQGFARKKSRFIREAFRALKCQPWLVWCGHVNMAPIAAIKQKVSSTTWMIVATHGIEVWNSLPFWKRYALQIADYVTTPSEITTHCVHKVQNVPKSRIWSIPWGLEYLPNESILTSESSAPVLLTVARLAACERYKGIDHVIQVLPRILRVVPEVEYWIIGDGDDRPRLVALARQMGVGNRVRFLGYVSEEQLHDCYRRCTVLTMPSRGEGFGFVYLEAMAYGKPVVAGAHGGPLDFIQDRVNGFVVQYGNLDQLTEVLIAVLTNPRLRQRVGQNARETVLSRYTFAHFRARIFELLDRLRSW